MRRSYNVLITGASGLIGAALVQYILEKSRSETRSPVVYAAGRDVLALKRKFGPGVECVAYDALKPVDFDVDVDVLIHAASFASPELFVQNPVETMWANVYGIHELLEYARRGHARKIVYVSSSEIYGQAKPREDGFTEEDYGFVDVLNPRSSYPIGKRAAETLCASYAKEYGVNVSIVRPGHIYGPTASPKDRRVSSVFAWAAARGEPIIMKSAGTSRRSYTHCMDCASAIMTVAEKGLAGEAYNVANRHGVCSIRRMAEIMADEGGVELKVETAKESDIVRFNPMDNSCLDPSKLEALGWRGEVGYEGGFRQTVRDLRERINKLKHHQEGG